MRSSKARRGAAPEVLAALQALIDRLNLGCAAPQATPTPPPGTPPSAPPSLSPTPTAPPTATHTPPALPTPTPFATPTAVSGSVAALTPPTALSGNCIAIMNTDSFGSATVPIQIGRGFIAGEIPHFPTATLNGAVIPTQAHVKSRWSDDTVKHAIMVFYVPLAVGETRTVCFADQTSDYGFGGLSRESMLAPALNFDARIDVVQPGGSSSASARAALSQGRYETWFSGLNATSVVIGDRTTGSLDLGAPHATVRPVFYATFFPGANGVRIRFTAEATNSERLGDATYDVTLQLGHTSPNTVYQRSQFTQFARTVWTREFWLGPPQPRFTIKHNLAHQAATTLLPNYDTSIAVTSTAVTAECNAWRSAPRDLGERGLFTRDMASSGGRGELGLLPRWVVMYLYTGNGCLQESVFGHADLAGAWPLFLREGRSSALFGRAQTTPGIGRYLTVYGRPTFWVSGQTFYGSPTDRVTPVTPLAANPFAVDWAHMPDLFSVQYLLSGDRHYLEMLHGQALSSILGRQPGTNALTRGPSHCFELGNIGQTRSDAWLIRTLATALAYSPDGLPETAELRYRTECLTAAWHGARDLANPLPNHTEVWSWARSSVRYGTGGNDCGIYGSYPYPTCTFPFGQPANSVINFWADPAGTIVSGQVNSPAVVMPWQYNYLIAALVRARELGLPTDALVEWVGRFTTEQLLNPGFDRWLSGTYYFPARDPVTGHYVASYPAALALYTPMVRQTAQSSFLDGLTGVEHSYPIILRMALEMLGTAANAPAARSVYATMTAGYTIPFQNNPQWAVIDR